jgi:acetate kinase
VSRVLVINTGSSSLKYQLLEMATERMLASGLVDRIGEERSVARHTTSEAAHEEGAPASVSKAFPEEGASASVSKAFPEERASASVSKGRISTRELAVPDHTAAFAVMLEAFAAHGPDLDSNSPVAIGHRVVHGGDRFAQPTLITDAVKQHIDELSSLAPLHNPPNLAGIVAAQAVFADVPHVAVFDTAFHQSLAPAVYTYAIDATVAAASGIRRYGFHGTSFQFVTGAAARLLGRPVEALKLIELHIGNGASACAVDRGRSVETSMGLTPLEGLVMGTRPGDLDPGVLIHLERSAGLGFADIDDLLSHHSGLFGLTGHGDVRDVQAAARAGNAAAALALEVYLHRIRHYVGAYLAQLGGADAIVFTAGVGENNAAVRAGALSGLDALGIRIDPGRNDSPSRQARVVSADDSPIAVLVVPTNEELEIARQALSVVQSTR